MAKLSVNIEIEAGTHLVGVPVYVNGSGPYRLHLDTGASTTTLTGRLAAELGLSTYQGSRTEARGLGGGMPVEFAHVDSLRVGELEFGSQEVYVLDLDKIMGRRGDTDGVLGHSTLKDYVMTLNYSDKRLELGRPESTKGLAGDDTEGWMGFKYIQDTHLVTLPAIINDLDPVDLVVDTGAGSTVLTPEFVQRVGIDASPVPGIARGLGGDVELKLAKVQSVAVGSAMVNDPQVVVVDLGRVSPRGQLIENGILGYNFLARFEMTLDYPNKMFRLKPANLS